MLLNLVGNALKFTQPGRCHGARLAAAREATAAFASASTVRDTGVGIAPERQGDAVQRLHPGRELDHAGHYGGSGLGLAISKRLVGAMGGDIGLESAPGCGSLFWFERAARGGRAAMAAERVAFDPASVPPRRILLAEDVRAEPGRVVRDARALRAPGGCRRERRGRRRARAAEGGFDLVLMDVQMPVMDGVEATRRIRRLPAPAGEVPIVALTASVIVSERERYRAAGIDACVSKPIDWSHLFATIAEIAGRRPSASGRPPPAADSCGTDAAPAPDPRLAAPESGETTAPPLLDDVTIGQIAAGLPPDAVTTLLRRALDSAGRSCAQIAASTSEPGDVAAELHRLKGTSGSFGFRRVSALAEEAEAAARDGAGLPDKIDRLAASVAATRAELRRTRPGFDALA